MERDSYINLFKKINENLKARNYQDAATDSFNVFKVLGIEYREIYICRLLGAILDPDGAHGLHAEPLKLFLRQIGWDNEISEDDLSGAYVGLEDSTDNNRRVDILIRIGSYTIPIEVKIWSDDREAQLNDYYHHYFRNDFGHQIYYLTPDGKKPSDSSRGKLNDGNIRCISFSKDISAWLNTLSDNIPAGNRMVAVLQDFKEVITDMCSKEKAYAEILSAVSLNEDSVDNDNLKALIKILESGKELWEEIRKQYLYSKIKLGDGYELTEPQDVPKEYDGHCVLSVRNKSDEIIAWIFIATNLYLVAKRVSADAKKKYSGKWYDLPDASDDEHSAYPWIRFGPNGIGKSFALNKPTSALVDCKEVHIEELIRLIDEGVDNG